MTPEFSFRAEAIAPYKHILESLAAAGFEAYFVGGCVRDIAMEITPRDFDVCTNATPAQIAQVFPDASFVGTRFGVCLVPVNGGVVEVATFRKPNKSPGQTAPEEYTQNIYEDVHRRDFTINAMLMDASGLITDSVGGLADIQARVIRAVDEPAERIQQDPMRMMRAVRLAAKLDFKIDARLIKAINEHRPLLAMMPVERISAELSKILTCGHADRGVDLLMNMGLDGLMEHIIPELYNLQGVQQNPKYHPEGDVYTHTLKLLEQLEPGCSVTLALAALLHDIGKPATFGMRDGQPTFYGHDAVGADMADEILRRLGYSTEIVSTVVSHVKQHMTFRFVQDMRRGKLLRFIRQPNFDELKELHRIDVIAGSGNLENLMFIDSVLNSTPEAALRPEPLLRGQDLIDMGYKPGKLFRIVLEETETEQLEGRVINKEEAAAFARGVMEHIGEVVELYESLEGLYEKLKKEREDNIALRDVIHKINQDIRNTIALIPGALGEAAQKELDTKEAALSKPDPCIRCWICGCWLGERTDEPAADGPPAECLACTEIAALTEDQMIFCHMCGDVSGQHIMRITPADEIKEKVADLEKLGWKLIARRLLLCPACVVKLGDDLREASDAAVKGESIDGGYVGTHAEADRAREAISVAGHDGNG